MARRARVKVLCDEEERVIAVHDGYKRMRCMHTRKVQKMKEHIRIVDEIDCEGMAYLHFMPKENIVLDGNRLLGSDYCIEFKVAREIEPFTSMYASEYNKREERRSFRVSFDRRLETIIQ